MSGLTRYGVFLRPDPRTCAAVTFITTQLRAQFGLVSANAFPPHATLAGSLPLRTSHEELLEALSGVLAQVSVFTVQNQGVRRLFGGLVYDLHRLDAGPNARLVELAAAVDEVVRPLLSTLPGLAADTYAPGRWHGHLSLASHDLYDRPDLRDELEEFVDGLAIDSPPSFTADTVALYRFEHDSWTGPWWRTMRWQHVRSLRLRRP